MFKVGGLGLLRSLGNDALPLFGKCRVPPLSEKGRIQQSQLERLVSVSMFGSRRPDQGSRGFKSDPAVDHASGLASLVKLFQRVQVGLLEVLRLESSCS